MRLYAAYNGMIGETAVCALVEAEVATEARVKAEAAFKAAGQKSEIVEIGHIPLPAVGEAVFDNEEPVES